jgi:predicted RNase H-like nuclease (RuvC/YqgF family)
MRGAEVLQAGGDLPPPTLHTADEASQEATAASAAAAMTAAAQIDALMSQNDSLKGQVASSQREIDSLKGQVASSKRDFQREIQALKQQLEEKVRQVTMLEAAVNMSNELTKEKLAAATAGSGGGSRRGDSPFPPEADDGALRRGQGQG